MRCACAPAPAPPVKNVRSGLSRSPPAWRVQRKALRTASRSRAGSSPRSATLAWSRRTAGPAPAGRHRRITLGQGGVLHGARTPRASRTSGGRSPSQRPRRSPRRFSRTRALPANRLAATNQAGDAQAEGRLAITAVSRCAALIHPAAHAPGTIRQEAATPSPGSRKPIPPQVQVGRVDRGRPAISCHRRYRGEQPHGDTGLPQHRTVSGNSISANQRRSMTAAARSPRRSLGAAQLLHRRFHGPQHQRRRPMPTIPAPQAWVQLLARNAHWGQASSAARSGTRVLPRRHAQSAAEPCRTVQRFAQLVQHPPRPQVSHPAGPKGRCIVDTNDDMDSSPGNEPALDD